MTSAAAAPVCASPAHKFESALPQPRQHLQAGIAIGRLHADLLLKREDSLDRVGPGAAVDAVCLEAVFVEPALDFLDLGQSRHALAAGELLMEWRIAANEIAEMEQSQRVAGGGIVGIDAAEVLSDQKRRSAADRQPQLHGVL